MIQMSKEGDKPENFNQNKNLGIKVYNTGYSIIIKKNPHYAT